MMLSRTANGLFWMSRYVERAENIARLIDAGRRLESLPGPVGQSASEWASITIAAGCRDTAPYDLDNVQRNDVTEFLLFDPDNPSSVVACLAAARENARALRGAITTEVWETINEASRAMRALGASSAEGGALSGLLDDVLRASFQMRGAIASTLLADDRFSFIELGKYIERVDATARLLDVKYNVLLPEPTDVGGGLDLMQWQQVLRAGNALRAYRHVYRGPVTAEGVVDLMVLNRAAPRSVIHGYDGICNALGRIGLATSEQKAAFERAVSTRTWLDGLTDQEIVRSGLHEFLTKVIVETNLLAVDIGEAFGFSKTVVPDDPEPAPGQQQSQSTLSA